MKFVLVSWFICTCVRTYVSIMVKDPSIHKLFSMILVSLDRYGCGLDSANKIDQFVQYVATGCVLISKK